MSTTVLGMEDTGAIFEESEKTFIELSNSQRLQIINALTNSSMNLTLIAKHLGINEVDTWVEQSVTDQGEILLRKHSIKEMAVK